MHRSCKILLGSQAYLTTPRLQLKRNLHFMNVLNIIQKLERRTRPVKPRLDGRMHMKE